VFIAGAAFSLREGITELIHPSVTSSFTVAYVVLAIPGDCRGAHRAGAYPHQPPAREAQSRLGLPRALTSTMSSPAFRSNRWSAASSRV
jgi:hypothetical protein